MLSAGDEEFALTTLDNLLDFLTNINPEILKTASNLDKILEILLDAFKDNGYALKKINESWKQVAAVLEE